MLWPLLYDTPEKAAMLQQASHREELELTRNISQRVAAMFTAAGLDSSPKQIEPLQLVRYNPGELFSAHHDYHATGRSSVQGELMDLVEDHDSYAAAQLLAISRALDSQLSQWHRVLGKLDREFEELKTTTTAKGESLQSELDQLHAMEVWWSRPWIRSPCSRPTPLALKKRAFRRAATRAACE